MNHQIASTAVAPVARRFTRALAETLFAPPAGGADRRRIDVRRDGTASQAEIVWGLGLFALTAVVLLWLSVQFGVPVTLVE